MFLRNAQTYFLGLEKGQSVIFQLTETETELKWFLFKKTETGTEMNNRTEKHKKKYV